MVARWIVNGARQCNMAIMDFLDVMHTYFRAEKNMGIALVPIGLAALGLAWHVWRAHSGGFMWAMMVPIALFGVGIIAGGLVLANRTDKQVTTLDAQFAEAPGELAKGETARMDKVNGNWPLLKKVWTGVLAISLFLLMTVRKDWVTGISLAFLMMGAFAMTVDVFAERRALIYSEGLEQLSRDTGQSPPAAPEATAPAVP